MFDPATKEFRISTDFGRLLINEITFFANNSIDKLKNLATLSPLFVNSLCMIFAETYKDDQMPTPIIGSLVTEFVQTSSPPFIYTFTIPAHVEIGAMLLGSFFRWTVLSELSEEKSYSRLHLKLLECLSTAEFPVQAKPVVHTKYMDTIIDQIERAAKVKNPETIQRSIEKLAQLVQVSKAFLYGNLSILVERLKKLPKNALMDLVIASMK